MKNIFGNVGESESPKYSLNRTDLMKSLRMGLMCAGAGFIAYLLGVLPSYDLGKYGVYLPLILAVLEQTRRFFVDYSANA